MAALTEKGFKRPIFSEILDDQIQKAKELFGEDIETDEKTPLGKFIRITVYDLARAYEDLENIYYARFPNTARGTSLDRLCVFAGITRNPPTAAQHTVRFTGVKGYEITAGTLVATNDNVEFYVEDNVTIGENETAETTVRCTELGTIGNVTVGAIEKFVNPDANVYTIEHIARVTIATDEENDTALRKRFAETIAGTGSATAEAIKAEVMRVTNVRSCRIVENDKDTKDADGRPAHSFETYVAADEDIYKEVAAAIFRKKPVGIQSYGTITETVKASDNTDHVIKFSPIDFLNIVVSVNVQKTVYFPADGAERIKTNLINYIAGFAAGEDVNLSSLYGYVHSVEGVAFADITLKAVGGSETTRVSVPVNKAANLLKENIRVTVTDYAD